jgi:8-oxo-dGTP pyrophosphatase MutT (NUDIX family)
MKQTDVRISSRAFVQLPNTEVLVFLYRAYKPKRNGPLFDYDLPGGGLEHFESPAQCAIRELKEETNLTGLTTDLICEYDNVLTYFDRFENIEKTVRRIGWIFNVQVRDLTSFKMEEDANLYSTTQLTAEDAKTVLAKNYPNIK